MNEGFRFRDRYQAGSLLATELTRYRTVGDVTVLALPRGGVPVGYEVAQALDARLDVFVVRKLGVPSQPELAMGAIAAGGVEVLNGDVITAYNIPAHVIHAVAVREGDELARRLALYRGDRPWASIQNRTVILVDDGLATGSTMKAAVNAVWHERPTAVVVAVPVAAVETVRSLARYVDEIVCVHTPPDFSAVGRWYDDFAETTDEEVRDLLNRYALAHS